MSYKIGMISLGCAKNLINSEQMLGLLSRAGYEITGDAGDADALVINTCAFIESAKSEAIDNILNYAALKTEGRLKKIIVTGCLAQRYSAGILKELPEVDAVVGCGSYDDIVNALELAAAGERPCLLGDIDASVSEAPRIIDEGAGWAYIKIAEGCDNHCAYCVIPSIRGSYRSRPMENIVEEARKLAADGIRELIVVAQDITRYGTDMYSKPMLAELIRRLAAVDGLEWIRLHYLYPDMIDDELIDTVAAEPKVVKYLDIPIQHINDAVLRLMNRRGTGAEIEALFKKLRERIPGVVIRTSIITGLPGEGEEEFEQLCEFLKRARIERAGVFAFSPEEGTPAFDMDRPDAETAAHRAELLVDIQSRIMDEFNEGRVGTVTAVMADAYDGASGRWCGRSGADSPDVDGRVFFTGEDITAGKIYDVKITNVIEGDLEGVKV